MSMTPRSVQKIGLKNFRLRLVFRSLCSLSTRGGGGVGGYTRETGTIWQIGVLTAERSTFWAQKMQILGCFALRFQ